MANWVLSIRRLRSAAFRVNLCVISPGARSGKSLSGSVCKVKRERPARIASAALSPEDSSTICAPSGSFRTISKNMWAGTVVEPPGPTSAAIVSVTSTSRSVALRLSFDRSARTSTLARIGIVLRRSTTRCTWPSDFNNSDRSTVTFIAQSIRYIDGESGAARVVRQDQAATGPAFSLDLWPRRSVMPRRVTPHLFLQLPLERLDLLRHGGIVARQGLDLARGARHRGVVPAAQSAAVLGERA